MGSNSRFWKKAFSTLMISGLAFCNITISAVATDGKKESKIEITNEEMPALQATKTLGDYTYEIIQDYRYNYKLTTYVKITKYSGTSAELVIPSELDGLPVTTIGSYAFSNNSYMEKLTVPSSVLTIETEAFSNCVNLESVKLNDGLTEMEGGCFNNCISLKTVNLPSTLKTVKYNDNYGAKDKGVFLNCVNLSNVTINSACIGKEMFKGCIELSEIHIPKSVTVFGANAFDECENLEKVSVESEYIGIGAFKECKNLNSVTLKNTTSIGANAFENCTSLTEIGLPSSLKTIGSYAFNECTGLTGISLPKSLESIGSYAFSGCVGFKKLKLPDSLQSMGAFAFGHCSNIKEVTIPRQVTYFEGAFQNCESLKKVNFECGTVSALAFKGCKQIEEIVIPKSVQNIGQSAFADCIGMKKLTILGTGEIGEKAFSNCRDMKEVNMKSSYVSKIHKEAFRGSGISELITPKSLKEVGDYAFAGCPNLVKISLNEGLTSIGEYSFGNNPALESVNIPSTANNLGYSCFRNCESLIDVDIRNTVISYAEFSQCTSLEKVIIPESVQEVGSHSFRGCTSLEKAVFLGDLPRFGECIFIEGNSQFEINYLEGTKGWPHNFGQYSPDKYVQTMIGKTYVTELTLDVKQLNLKSGEEATLKATVAPNDATIKMLNWTTTNRKVATVDANGIVTAVGPGNAEITVSTTDGSNLSCSCVVNVTQVVTGIALDKETVDLYPEESITLVATVSPADATNKEVSWSSSNEAIATVDQNGKVSAISVGVVDITVTSVENSNITYTCKVNIKERPTSRGDVTKVFTDIPEKEWYVDAVQFVYDRSIMNGISGTTFGPKGVLTREQFITVLYNMEGSPEITFKTIFDDVTDSTLWYANSVTWAAENGITSGIGDNKFGTGKEITREQLATLLYNYAQKKDEYKLSVDENVVANFPDANKIDSWASNGMKWAITNGVMGGKAGKDGQKFLDPLGKATRAECAQMIKNLKENAVK